MVFRNRKMLNDVQLVLRVSLFVLSISLLILRDSMSVLWISNME